MPLTASDIEDLLTLSSGESEVLEFKSELPAFNDKGKAEFLKDVCAMANASGGLLLYGIQEHDGCACGLTIRVIEEQDALMRRLAQTSQDNIEPAIRIALAVIRVRSHDVLAVEVPQSFSGPYRFKFNDKQRFVRRYDRHINDLTYDQLRSAFGASQEKQAVIQAWWQQVDAKRYFPEFRIEPGPYMAAALVPIVYDGRTTFLDPQKVEQNWSELSLKAFWGGSQVYNYHGLCVHPGPRGRTIKAFSQAERLGPIVTWQSISPMREGRQEDCFYGPWFVDFIRDSFRVQKQALKRNSIRGSCFYFCKIMGITGWEMLIDDSYGHRFGTESTTDSIEVGPIFIDDFEKIDMDSVDFFRDAANRLWQAYGHACCPARYLERSLDC